jgi:hypothetical protein
MIRISCFVEFYRIFFLRTRRRSARHCIKLGEKRPKVEYKEKATRTTKVPTHG